MTMNIKRNKDGQQNLRDLRAAVKDSPSVADVYIVGGTWQISHVSGIVESCPYYCDERQALQLALFSETESKEESRYHKSR